MLCLQLSSSSSSSIRLPLCSYIKTRKHTHTHTEASALSSIYWVCVCLLEANLLMLSVKKAEILAPESVGANCVCLRNQWADNWAENTAGWNCSKCFCAWKQKKQATKAEFLERKRKKRPKKNISCCCCSWWKTHTDCWCVCVLLTAQHSTLELILVWH